MNTDERKVELELEAIDLQNKKLHLERKALEQKLDFEQKEFTNIKKKIDPIYATIFVALVGFFSTTIATIINNSNQNSLERQKFESELIKKSLDEKTIENKIKSLKLLSTLKLIKNEEMKLALDKFLQDSVKAAENLPTTETNKPIEYIGKGLNENNFKSYLDQLDFSSWKPELIVLHHTVSPDLKQWEKLDPKNRLANLSKLMGNRFFKAGPHLIIDRDSIWVFSPLNKQGTHSPSWNKVSIGVEMVGNYDVNNLDEKVSHNTIIVLAALIKKFNLNPSSCIKFHSEDPKTRGKTCPGKNVNKIMILDEVIEVLNKNI